LFGVVCWCGVQFRLKYCPTCKATTSHDLPEELSVVYETNVPVAPLDFAYEACASFRVVSFYPLALSTCLSLWVDDGASTKIVTSSLSHENSPFLKNGLTANNCR
jgi:hypothetical protein